MFFVARSYRSILLQILLGTVLSQPIYSSPLLSSIERSELCQTNLGNTNVPPYIWEATKQCVGNCGFHAKQRLKEYWIFSKTGRRVDLNIAFKTVNRLREPVEAIMWRVPPRNNYFVEEDISEVRVSGYSEEFNHHGELPREIGIQESELKGFEADLQDLLRRQVVNLRLSTSESDLGVGFVHKDANLSEGFRKARSDALAAVNKFYEERGAGLNQKFQYGGEEHTPVSFSKSLNLNSFSWRHLSLRYKYTDKDAYVDLEAAAAVIRKQKYPIFIFIKGIGKLAESAEFAKLYGQAHMKFSSKSDAHFALIVGISDEPDPTVIIQNSWGATSLGPEGLLPIRLSLLVEHVDSLSVAEDAGSR